MRTVYIFGAGASAAEGAPVVHNFLRSAFRYFKIESCEADLEIVWEFLEYFYGKRVKINSVEDLDRYPAIDEIFNLVDWYLLNNQAFSVRFTRPRLYHLKKALVKLISMTLDKSLPSYNGIHQSFVNRVLNNDEELPAFISLNYDLVLDRAIRAAGREPEYGFYGSHGKHPELKAGIPLYKLHGSLNWSFCPLCGEISQHEDKVAHLLFKENNSVTCLNCGSDNAQAVIIAPTLYKSHKINRLQNIWESSAGAVNCSDCLAFIGYSLDASETSIIALVKRALNAPEKKRKIIVVNPNEEACMRYRQFFGNECSIICSGFTGEAVF